MALALSASSALSAAMLIGSAVLINPLFIEKVPLKKGLRATLAIGLFIGSIAVFPIDQTTQNTTVAENAAIVKEASYKQSANAKNKNDYESELKLIEDESGIDAQEQAKQTSKTIETSPDAITPTPTSTPNIPPTITPTPTMVPTPTITPKPTPTEKPTPTDAPVTRSVGISIMDYSDTVQRNSYAFIKIQGAPDTEYTCDVKYKSGWSEAAGLGAKRSDANGIVSWRWKVGSRTSLSYTPTIYISGGGDSLRVDFDVTG